MKLVLTLGVTLAAVGGVALATACGGPEIVEHGSREQPWVALTFDADPGGYDPAIVRELRRTGTAATIFVTGRWAEAHPDVVRALAADPLFELESHSYSHAAFTADCYGLGALGSDADKRREVTDTTAVLTRLTGVAPRFFRFPGGCYADGDLELIASLGQVTVQWDVISGDSFERDPQTVASTVVDGARAGSIVVMHLNGAPNAPATADALALILPELRRRGLRLVTLRELLAPL